MGTFVYVNFVCLLSRMRELKKELNIASDAKVKTVLQRMLEVTLKSSLTSVELYDSDRSQSTFEDDGFIEFDNCKLHLKRLDEANVREVITKLCTTCDFYGIYMSLRKEEADMDLLSSMSQKPLHKMNKVNSFALGTIVNIMSFVPHFDSLAPQETWKVTNSESIAEFEHDINSLAFYFRCDSTRRDRFRSIRYKFHVRYDFIKSIIFSPNTETMAIYLVLKCPPMLYHSLDDNINFQKGRRIQNKCDERLSSDEWIRTSSFAAVEGELYGKCNVFRLDVPLIKHPEKMIPHIHYECPWSLLNCLPSFRDIAVYFAALKQEPLESASNKNLKVILDSQLVLKETQRYDIQYALECIQSHSWQLADEVKLNNLATKFRKLINKLAEEDADALEDTIYLLYDAIQTSHFINIFESLESFFLKRRRIERRLHQVPKNNIMFKRVAITPTRILVLPKLPYKQSLFAHDPPEGSVQESFMYRADYAIRAELKDDDLNKLTWSMMRIVNWELEHLQRMEEKYGRLKPEEKEKLINLQETDEIGERLVNEYLEKCIKRKLINGLDVCGRVYHIFGSSPSQLKEFGMIMYAKDCYGQTAENVRRSLGDVYNEKNVAKFITRVGLSVSEVEEFIDVSNVLIQDDLDDIVGGSDDQYTFSDGCGMISRSLADKIFEQLKDKSVMENLTETPSAFQIRIGGCKGMLAINPNLKGDQIKIRKSMRKYKSPNMSLLGILKVSNVRAVHFNRPLIMLLDQLGTNRKYLLQLLGSHLEQLSKAFVDDNLARDTLYNHSTLSRYVDMALLARSGIRLLDEPFFRMCLESIIAENLRKMKEKAKIKIDRNYGRSMFGVIDETFKLKQGQIFVRYTDINDPNKKIVLTGKILVTKFPCMHPGDVQVFEAVDIGELHHIVDCIVFPAVGDRPHPDEMAGSDLDGDEYAVIWDKKLYPKKIMEPMGYEPGEAPKVENEVTDDDILDFFAMYVKEYSVGRIADAHLAWADIAEEGVFSKICMNLAKKYAVSLDFPKTGITMKLDKKEIVKLFPDYMEREKTRGFYTSKRVLGEIYRSVKFIERGIVADIPLDFNSTNNKAFHHPNCAKYMDSAERAYYNYSVFVQELQYRYKITSEASIIFGNTEASDEFLISSQQSKVLGYKIRDLVRNMFATIKDDFENEFRHRNDEDVFEDKLAKASAYYVFTANCPNSVKYYGLPWLFSEYLAAIAANKKDNITRNYSDDVYGFVINNINSRYDPDKSQTISDHVSKSRKFFEKWLRTYKKQMLHLSNQLLSTEINDALELETVDIIFDEDEAKTCGEIIVNILKKFTESLFDLSEDLTKKEKMIKRALAIASLMTLQSVYKTRNTDPLVQHKPLVQNLKFQQYYLSFVGNKRLKDFIARNDDSFRKKMMVMAGVHTVHGRWFERRNQHHYYLSAFGTPVSLQALNLVIASLHTQTDFDLEKYFLVDHQ